MGCLQPVCVSRGSRARVEDNPWHPAPGPQPPRVRRRDCRRHLRFLPPGDSLGGGSGARPPLPRPPRRLTFATMPPDTGPPRILVIEDSKQDQAIYRRTLAEFGLEFADSGEE